MFNYAKFSWTTAARVEKSTKWKHKDGTWWTNDNGKVVPYNESQHGPAKAHSETIDGSDLNDHQEALQQAANVPSEQSAVVGNEIRQKWNALREVAGVLSQAQAQGLHVPSEYAHYFGKLVAEHPELSKDPKIQALVEHLKGVGKWSHSGEGPTSIEQDEAWRKSDEAQRRAAIAEATRRHRRNNPPGAGEDRYGD